MAIDFEEIAKMLYKPSGYASLKLGMKLHPKQRAVLDALFSQPKTKISLLCGNGVGKTRIIIAAAILYALEIRNANVISTNATYRQGVSQLIPALKSYAGLYPSYRFLDDAISINRVNQYLFFSADSEATFQGYHETNEQPLLIIVDEAEGVTEEIFRAIDRCSPTWLLVVGSPWSPEGEFYNIETKVSYYNQFQHYKIMATECLKSQGYWINDKDIAGMIEKYGENHPLVLSSVYAQFTENVEDAVISISAVRNCINHPPEMKIFGRPTAGIDFGGGKAETVIFIKNGNRCYIDSAFVAPDTMESVGKIVNRLNQLKEIIGLQPDRVNADADGLGLPMCDRLSECGWPINLWHGGLPARDEQYKNKIAEAYIEGARKIEKREIIIPDDQELIAQLVSRKAKYISSGKLQLESKQDMAKRNVPSPDRADALMMALSDPETGYLTTVIPVGARSAQYTGLSDS